MEFDWSSFGAAPQPNELEVTVFGPGFGESILVHPGGGRWVVIDSCIDPSDRAQSRSVAEKYLQAIGVDMAKQVDSIVATHWHDDHIRGLGGLLERCSAAKFSCPQVLVKEEFGQFVEEMGCGASSTNGAKISEMRKVLRILNGRGAVVKHAANGREIMVWPSGVLGHAQACTMRSLSPSDLEFELFLRRIASMRPKPGEPKRAVPSPSKNIVAVVLHLQFDNVSILLGSDMEIHADDRRGWVAAITDASERHLGRASVYKVAHHGSKTGDHSQIWQGLLVPKPLCIVTPFNRLPDTRKLPTAQDLDRLKGSAGAIHLTAPHRQGAPKIKGRDPAVVRSLQEQGITMRSLATPFGAVRLRCEVDDVATLPRTEMFGAAMTVV